MTILQIYDVLNTISPFELQSSWDKSGINVGMDGDVEWVYLSLDLDLQSVIGAPPNTLFITHHPLIFKPILNFKDNKYPNNIIKQMICKNQGHIAIHTNFDLSHLNEYFVKNILGFEILKKNDFLIYSSVNFSFEDFIIYLKNALKIDFLRCVKNSQKVRKIAVCTGSGSSLINELDSDVDYFLTGDLKYHEAFESLENNIGLIDINHFESERYFAEILAPILKNNLQNFSKKLIIKNSKNPFLIL